MGRRFLSMTGGFDAFVRVRFNGWGATAFDSLDTMLFMGLEEEYKHALEIVRKADLSTAEVSRTSHLRFEIF